MYPSSIRDILSSNLRPVRLEGLQFLYVSIYGEVWDMERNMLLKPIKYPNTINARIQFNTRKNSIHGEFRIRELLRSAWGDVSLEEIPKTTLFYKLLVANFVFNQIPKEELRLITPDWLPWYAYDASRPVYIRTNGEVWSGSYPFPLRTIKHANGYCYVALYSTKVNPNANWKQRAKNIPSHQLVARAFIPIPAHLSKQGLTYDDLAVNHIDGNKHNNHVSNLEWVTDKENVQHALETGLYIPKKAERIYPIWKGKQITGYIDDYATPAY